MKGANQGESMEDRMIGIARQYRELGEYILANFPDDIVNPETVVKVALKLLGQLKRLRRINASTKNTN